MTTMKKLRGKSKPRHERTRDAIGRVLLEAMESGEVVIDHATGRPAVSADGEPLRKPPSAAMVRAAMRFVETEAARNRAPLPYQESDLSRLAKAAAGAGRIVIGPQ